MNKFKVGDKVRIISGPYEGDTGEVLGYEVTPDIPTVKLRGLTCPERLLELVATKPGEEK